jgi:hypothetical protein
MKNKTQHWLTFSERSLQVGDVSEYFLKPLARQFTLPKGATDDPAAWASDYLRSLGSFDDETLKTAAQNLMDVRMTRTFPLVGECNAACRDTIEAEAIKQMESGREHVRRENDLLERKYPECSQYRIEAAHRMMKDYPLIKQAADEFWIWGLFDFCCKEQETPDKYQVETVKRKSKAVIRDLMAAIGDGTRIENASMMRGNLLGMWTVAQQTHRLAVGLPRMTSDDLNALVAEYKKSEAA